MNWLLLFTHPLDDNWFQNEDKLADLAVSHGGTYDGGGTDFKHRETFCYFPTKEAAEECGKAAWYLYIKYLSWEVMESATPEAG